MTNTKTISTMKIETRPGIGLLKWASIAGFAWIVAGCGGGGGSANTATQVQPSEAPSFERERIQVSTFGPACIGVDCLFMDSAFIDDDGEVTLFWYEGMRGSGGWYVTSNVPGSTAVQTARRLADAPSGGDNLQPLALGGKRFAAVLPDTQNWTSALVDLSTAADPVVTPRVATPLNGYSQLIHGLDGNFAMSFSNDAPTGTFSLGGNTQAQSVKVQRPKEYTNYGSQHFAAATALMPTAWWAFTATPAGTDKKHAYLALVDLDSGTATVLQDTLIKTWEVRTGNRDCTNFYGRDFIVQEFARGQAAVGRLDYNPDTAFCDVFVDGVALAGDRASADRGPALGGSSDGLVAVWQESSLTQGTPRIVWRRRDAATGQWTAPTLMGTQAALRLTSYTTGPGGNLAIAWEGCDGPVNPVCIPYVSKYVRGVWSTQQYAAAGSNPSWPRLAINVSGQAVVTWTNSYDGKCSRASAENCLHAYAYRF